MLAGDITFTLSKQAEMNACLMLLTSLHLLQSGILSLGNGPTHINEYIQDNPSQVCPEAHLLADSRFCKVET